MKPIALAAILLACIASARATGEEEAYYLVAMNPRELGFAPLVHIRPPQARAGCEKQAEVARKRPMTVGVRYECWTDAKYTASIIALKRCKRSGVGCDQLPF
jgi:hypothetical protein